MQFSSRTTCNVLNGYLCVMAGVSAQTFKKALEASAAAEASPERRVKYPLSAPS